MNVSAVDFLRRVDVAADVDGVASSQHHYVDVVVSRESVLKGAAHPRKERTIVHKEVLKIET